MGCTDELRPVRAERKAMSTIEDPPTAPQVVLLVVAMAIGVLIVARFHIEMPYQVLAPLLAGSTPALYRRWWRHRTDRRIRPREGTT